MLIEAIKSILAVVGLAALFISAGSFLSPSRNRRSDDIVYTLFNGKWIKK